MNPQLKSDITSALELNYQAKDRGEYLQQIECPSCHKREAFTEKDSPWVVKCGRDNKCGDLHHVKDLFPEFFNSWTERYQPKADEPSNPTAVADGYLRDGRGFDLIKIRGWYSQEYFHKHEIDAGTTTVRFPLPNGAFWERLLDKPERFGKQKGRAVGKYKGAVWIAPIFDYPTLAEQKEIWITEGIFDAIALIHVGLAAVSSISCSNYIELFLTELAKHCPQGKRPTLIWALDGDRAGRDYTLKHVEHARKAGWKAMAAQNPPLKGRRFDWNDLLQIDKLSDRDLALYRYHGELLLAETPGEMARLMYNHRERRQFWFRFDHSIYWWKLDMDAYDRECRKRETDDASRLSPDDRNEVLKAAGLVTEICNAFPKALYYQANRITGECWYYFEVSRPEGGTEKKDFTPKQLANSNEFTNSLLSIKNAWWSGTAKQLRYVMQQQMKYIKTVETIDFIGYSKEHQAWIWSDLAVKNGKHVTINAEDYFEFGKLSLKSLSSSIELSINPDASGYNPIWTQHLTTAFGTQGVVALAYWLGSLFAEQIRAAHKSYPFIEIVGQAGAGKSTLIEFLWKLCGRADYEGFDPCKGTRVGLSRKLAQAANLPLVMIESDREQAHVKQQFDWDEFKTAFNGRSIRATGVKNNGNDTYEPPFRASIVISQNAPVDAGEAIMSRIVHVFMTRETQTANSKSSAEWLERVPMEQVSGFILNATQAEKTLMALFSKRASTYEMALLQNKDIRMVRIAKCHSQLMALVDCLGKEGLALLDDATLTEAKNELLQMACQRQQALSQDHPVVTEFWEAYDYIENTRADSVINHYGDDQKRIAVNLKEFERACGDFKLRLPDARELKRHLKGSKTRKFKESNHPVRSQIHPTNNTVKCWIFDNA